MNKFPYISKKKLDRINLSKTKSRGQAEWMFYVYWKGYYDNNFFTKYFLRHYITDNKGKVTPGTKYHTKAMEALFGDNNTIQIRPRGFGKTTTIKISIIKKICYEMTSGILTVMPQGLGEKVIGDIAEEFENNKEIKSIFGELVPNRTAEQRKHKWRANYLMFLNDIDLQTVSRGGSIRGNRKEDIYIDDPEEDKDVQNPVITQKFKDRVSGTIIPILHNGGNLYVTGTVISNDCFVKTIYDTSETYDKFFFQAVEDPKFEQTEQRRHLIGGNPVREEARDIESLDKRLQDMQDVNPMNGYKIFLREYMHEVHNLLGSLIFDKDIVKDLPEINYRQDDTYKLLHIYKEPCQCAWGIDLSMGGKGGDFSTIVARDHNFDLVFAYQGRILWYELIHIIDYLDGLGYIGTKVIERNTGTAQAIFDIAQDRPRYEDIYQAKTMGQVNEKETLNLGRNTTRSSKEKMIADLQYLVNSKILEQVDMREQTEMRFFMIDENGKINATSGKHDDLIIADSLSIQGVTEMFGVEVKKEIEKEK